LKETAMDKTPDGAVRDAEAEVPRREFLWWSSVAMAGGVVASYGTLIGMAGRYLYLYPAGTHTKAWLFLAELEGMAPGDSLQYESPTGAKIVVARQAANGTAEDFVALSSVCPHLGCQVQWEPHNNRFFCPCHNGVFDPQGEAVEGPPAAAGQSLARYPLKVEAGMLFIEVPVTGLGAGEEA
jgi:Rieske Fe-S protein